VTVSGHKIGGPKGIGALYVSADTIRAKRLVPRTLGGGQESGFRSGTENVPGIAGFGEAARLAAGNFEENLAAVQAARDAFLARLAQAAPDVCVHGVAAGIPHIVSLRVPGVRSEIMLNHLSAAGICVSAGSACSARAKSESRAMVAYGLTPEEADETVRVSFCPANTEAEAIRAAEEIAAGYAHLAKKRV